MTHPYLTALMESHCQDLELVGGKAQNLAKLSALGFPVPEAFCLTTEAYRFFVAANSLNQVVCSSLNLPSGSGPAALRKATEAIRTAFLAGIMPAELASLIERSYEQLGATPVAVRSSATMEDLAASSFAGGHDTFLNLRSATSLQQAVRECWASLWNERAVLYRQRFGINDDDLALAVVVQKMVPASVSGVVFTADPLTGDREKLVVEACRGLGQALVSGEVTADHYEIERRSSLVRDRRPGSQAKMLVSPDNGGVQAVPIPDRLRSRPCLDVDQLRGIAQIALQIESCFGSPQDIEWAFENNSNHTPAKIHILQTRPITTLNQKPSDRRFAKVRWENSVPGAIWVRGGGGLVEYLVAPPSPLYATAQLPAICRLHDDQALQMGTYTPAPTYALINGHYYSRQDYRIKPSGFLLPFRYWKVARTKAKWWREQALPEHLAGLARLSSFDISSASNQALLNQLESWFEFNANAWDVGVWASKNSQFTEPLFCRIFRKFIRPLTGGDALVFLRGFESQTMAGERAQWALIQAAMSSSEIADCIRRNPPAQALERLSDLPSARRWLQDLLLYCRVYGHATACHDYLYPTQADDPAKAIAAIRTRLEMPAGDPAKRQAQVAAEREKATEMALSKLSGSPLRKALFRWALAWAQEGAAIREDVFFHAFQGWPMARRAILEFGNRLVSAGALHASEGIFFLRWEEIKQAAGPQIPKDFRATVAERRKEHEWQSALTPPHWVPLGGPPLTLGRKVKIKIKRFLLGRREKQDGRLHGSPVSPGVVSGRARVIRSTSEFGMLRRGEILIAPAATPEWMPAFAVAAGLVTDTGGPLSHSSIIVREFGIPAVMGVQTATQSIADGQWITLDGGEGVIQLHQKSLAAP